MLASLGYCFARETFSFHRLNLYCVNGININMLTLIEAAKYIDKILK